jgi:predicted phosphoadenosine phosphosulfate sulfurtransferase
VLIGMRMVESYVRRLQFAAGGATYKTIKWCRKLMVENTRTFWPIYDFEDQDVWVCIARNELPYNRIYDAFFRCGIARRDMRVSSLIHETAYRWMGVLQEAEPATYGRFIRRVPGASTFGHMIEDLTPRSVPAAFTGWLEYRDYLLEHLVEPDNRDTFRRLWRGQEGDYWYERHVRAVVVNDVDNTKLHARQVDFDQGVGRRT